jgi:hypothetical protein
MRLLFNALAKFTCGLVMVALLIFLPAGTVNFAKGWLFMGLLFVPMFLAGLVMLAKAPTLLAKRLDVKEKQSAQKGVVGLSALMTTTLPAMEETVRQLQRLAQPPRIMVGGAVVTAEYAAGMGADYYAKDARAAVEIAREVLG